MAKWSYKVKLIKSSDLYNLSPKEKLVYEIVEKIATQSRIKMPEV